MEYIYPERGICRTPKVITKVPHKFLVSVVMCLNGINTRLES